MSGNVEIVIDGKDESGPATESAKANASGLSQVVTTGLGVAFGSVLTGAIGLATNALGGLADTFGGWMNDAMEGEKLTAKLEQTIKATGGAAGITAEGAQDLANELKDMAGGSDEAVIAAENVILRFKNISGETFPATVKASLDLAAAMGVDQASAALTLGKALEVPGEGLAKLKVAGITFTKDQEDQIKAMAAAGDVAGAQKIILESLAATTGGAAAAQAGTLSGKMEIMKNAMDDAGKGIAIAIMPALTKLFDSVIKPALPVIEKLAGLIGETLGKAMDGLVGAIQPLVPIVTSFFAILSGTADAGTVSNLKDSLSNFIPGSLIDAFTTISVVVQGFISALQIGQEPMGDWSTWFETLSGLVGEDAAKAIDSFMSSVWDFVDVVKTEWPKVQATISETVDRVVQFLMPILKEAFAGLMEIVGQVVAWFKENWPLIQKTAETVINGLKEKFDVILPAIRQLFEIVFPIIKTVVEIALNAILSVVKIVMQLINGDTTGALETLKGIFTFAWDKIKDGVTTAWEGIKQTIQTAWEGIKRWFDTLPATLLKVGEDLINAINQGISNMGAQLKSNFEGWIRNAISGLLGLLPDWLQKVLGINGQSVNFAPQVTYFNPGYQDSARNGQYAGIGGPVVNNYQGWTLNTSATAPQLHRNFELMKASVGIQGGGG